MIANLLQQVLDPAQRALFLDTDSAAARETGQGSAMVNTAEADVVVDMASTFLRCGMQQQDIGIMSPYRSQVLPA